MKDMSTALFRLDLSNRCVNYRKSNNNKVGVDAGKKREKTFLSFKKKSITRFLWCIINHGKLQLSQNTVKNPILNPSTHIYQSCSGPHWGLRRAPGALFDTHWTVSVLVGVKRVYRRALQGLYFT